MKTETVALRQFDAGKRNLGFIEGPAGYIVTENDFCHQVRSLAENIELRIRMPWEAEQENLPAFQVFTLEQIREMATPVTSFREWVHYWGIKARIRSNYEELLDSMREIGADPRTMPGWGQEPKAAA